MGAKPVRVGIIARQRRIAEHGMDRPMADRMKRHRLAPAAALRHAVVIFDPRTERAPAQETGRRPAHRLSQFLHLNQSSTAIPTAAQKATTPQKAQWVCA